MENDLMSIFSHAETWALIFAVITPPLIAWLQAPIRLWLARKKGQAFWKRFPMGKKDIIAVPGATGRDLMEVADEDDDNLLLKSVENCEPGKCHLQYIPWTEIEKNAPSWRKVGIVEDANRRSVG